MFPVVGNGFIEGAELDGFLREFVSSVNTRDVEVVEVGDSSQSIIITKSEPCHHDYITNKNRQIMFE